jgi:hypothetical protein
MASWEEILAEEPPFAHAVAACFAVRKHCTVATLRSDGSPRISGIEVEFAGGQLWLGMMPASVKAVDLRRDPRLALHSPTVDPTDDEPAGWNGEAKLAGRAVEVTDPTRADQPHRFRIDITEVVLTRIGRPADHLVIESWHPGRGLRQRQRR